MNVSRDDALGDLPASVVQRVLAGLSDRGPKVLAALRTAAALMCCPAFTMSTKLTMGTILGSGCR